MCGDGLESTPLERSHRLGDSSRAAQSPERVRYRKRAVAQLA